MTDARHTPLKWELGLVIPRKLKFSQWSQGEILKLEREQKFYCFTVSQRSLPSEMSAGLQIPWRQGGVIWILKCGSVSNTHSSVLAWRILGMEEPGGLPSMRSHRVGRDWSNLAAAAAVPDTLLRAEHSIEESFIWFPKVWVEYILYFPDNISLLGSISTKYVKIH